MAIDQNRREPGPSPANTVGNVFYTPLKFVPPAPCVSG